MLTRKGEGSPAQTGPPSTPKTQCQPGTTITKPKAYLHLTPKTANVNAAGSHKAPVRFPIRAPDAVAWAIFTLVVGVILIAACVLLTLGWPS